MFVSEDCKYKNKCGTSLKCNGYGNCALKGFLNVLNEDRTNPRFTEDKLIDELEIKYKLAFKEQYSKSKGHGGRPTGLAFEQWILNKLNETGSGITAKKGNVDFKFGQFAVDAALPDPKNPKTILEIKVYADSQHLLMLHALFARPLKPDIKLKIGLITFYNIEKKTKKETHPYSILQDLKESHRNEFEYFHLEDGWSKEMTRLHDWCKQT